MELNWKIKEMMDWPIGHTENTYTQMGQGGYQWIQRVPGGWIFWNEFASTASSEGLAMALSSGVFVPEPKEAAGFELHNCKAENIPPIVNEATGDVLIEYKTCKVCGMNFSIKEKGKK